MCFKCKKYVLGTHRYLKMWWTSLIVPLSVNKLFPLWFICDKFYFQSQHNHRMVRTIRRLIQNYLVPCFHRWTNWGPAESFVQSPQLVKCSELYLLPPRSMGSALSSCPWHCPPTNNGHNSYIQRWCHSKCSFWMTFYSSFPTNPWSMHYFHHHSPQKETEALRA